MRRRPAMSILGGSQQRRSLTRSWTTRLFVIVVAMGSVGTVVPFSFHHRLSSAVSSVVSSSSRFGQSHRRKGTLLFQSTTPSNHEDKNNKNDTSTTTNIQSRSKRTRFRQALPHFIGRTKTNDEASTASRTLDRLVLQTAIPSMINLAVVPIVNAVDTFWVGRLGLALALAGQSAANQACFTIFFMIAFLPNITAPLVAKAVASGNTDQAQDRVSESLWLCNVLGLLGTALLFFFPTQVLSSLVLEPNSPAMKYAAPYLRWRALGMVPSLISATGSAAYRGMLNTVTPLKVSLVTNAINLVLDPVFMFATPTIGFVGAAMATAISETVGGVTYLRLLFRRRLVRWSKLLRPPPWSAIRPLIQGGAAMLVRQLAINIGFLVATKRAQIMDPTGVSGAAYGIVMQLYSVFLICMLSFQGCAAALVPAALAKDGIHQARTTADRLLSWSSLVGLTLGFIQWALLPFFVPLFSTLPEVQDSIRVPAMIASMIHVVNGPILAGEGIMIGLGNYKELAVVTLGWIGAMVTCLSVTPLGQRLDGIMWSILLSSLVQQAGVLTYYLKLGPLAVKKHTETQQGSTSNSSTGGTMPSPTDPSSPSVLL